MGVSICCLGELIVGWEEMDSTGFKVLTIGHLIYKEDLYQSDLKGQF